MLPSRANPTRWNHTFTEVAWLLIRTDDALVRSAARLRQADATSALADRDNNHMRKRLDKLRRTLGIASSSDRSFL